MHDAIQDALDDLASAKSSTARQGRALDSLERLLAQICCAVDGDGPSPALQLFVALQDTFSCNVPFRLLGWISKSLTLLAALTTRTSKDPDPVLAILSAQLAQALSIMQGVALLHPGSKRYLGRRYPIDVLVELFYTARRVPPVPTSVPTTLSASTLSTSTLNSQPAVPLANVVLDTLLCILVDAPPAMRVFEDASGVQVLVKMFKRSATPRDVRMRCVEFLYFYLMDETSASRVPLSQGSRHTASNPDLVPTAPSSPTRLTHKSVLSVSQRSDSSVSSLESSTSAMSASTRATSLASSSRRSSVSLVSSPCAVVSPTKQHAPSGSAQPHPRSLSLLIHDPPPVTPRKAQIARLGIGIPLSTPLRPIDANVMGADGAGDDRECLAARIEEQLRTPRKPVLVQTSSLSQIPTGSTPDVEHGKGHRRARSSVEVGMAGSVRSPPRRADAPPLPDRDVRTMEEKKAFLGTMLGNVDALVEGLRTQGIFGLA